MEAWASLMLDLKPSRNLVIVPRGTLFTSSFDGNHTLNQLHNPP